MGNHTLNEGIPLPLPLIVVNVRHRLVLSTNVVELVI